MNSEISTKGPDTRVRPYADADTRVGPYGDADTLVRANATTDPKTDSALQPWQFFVLAALGCATAVTFMARGRGVTAILLLSVMMACAALVGMAALRALRPLVSPDEDRTIVIGKRTRAALEREKSLVLRSIKDLEFDHAMGKVSDKDFSEMGARLRARAAGLLRQLDAGTSYRQAIETEIEKRVGKAAPAVAAPAVAAPARPAAAPAAASDKTKTKLCLSCCTPNDPDARFCKGCGYQLGDW